MALNGLLDIEISVPDPQATFDFWLRRGMTATSPGVLGTIDRPVQMAVAEGSYRHLSKMHLSCESEEDLAAIARRLTAAGVAVQVSGTTLTCTDPIFGHSIVIDVGQPHPLTPAQHRAFNGPGEQARRNVRADAVTNQTPPPPRRIGHVVLATPMFREAGDFYVDTLGFRVSDGMFNRALTFMRVESDHHNLLIQPGPTSYLNHYAVEVDDIDAVGQFGTSVLAEDPDSDVVGIGRHNLGSNVFWYMRDPAGNMFEFFSDMDQIVDDEVWDRVHRRDDWDGADGPAGFSVWGPKNPPEAFINPPDVKQIAAAREALGLR
jgi:catechol 2,3-dioxygenase-like lactoylglutathione lyase family enzyme